MTSITASGFDFSTAAIRSPRISFAARLAKLQARTESGPHLSDISSVAGRFALALIPFVGLTWVFVTI